MQTTECQTPGRPYLLGHNPETKTAILLIPDCGLWTCEHCAEQKKYHWMLRAFKGATQFLSEGQAMSFVTLTSKGGKGRSRSRALWAFRQAWPRLRKRAEYENGAFEYVAIPEQHRNGVMHLHLVALCGLSARFWKDAAVSVGLGYMSESAALSASGYVPSYVAKYLGKQFCQVVWPKGFRRARASAGWPELIEPNAPLPFEWRARFSSEVISREIAELRRAGYDVSIREKIDFPIAEV